MEIDKRAVQKQKRHALNKEIGKRIQQSRIAANITQEYFSEQLDVSPQFISDLERGAVGASLVTIVEISNILNTTTDYILKGKKIETENIYQIGNRYIELEKEEKELIEQGINITLKALQIGKEK